MTTNDEPVGGALLITALAKQPTLNLRQRSFDVLTRMCASAVDRDDATRPGRFYFAGWVPLSMMLGYDAPADGVSMSLRARHAVRCAVRELIGAGLIEDVGPCAPAGETSAEEPAAYRITL